MNQWLRVIGLLGIIASVSAPIPSAGQTPSMQMAPEQRQKMAKMHEQMARCFRSDRPLNECQKMAEFHDQMAGCLRSDRPVGECRQVAMTRCREMMGEEGCPMMGMMGKMMEGEMQHRGEATHEQANPGR